MKCPITQCVKLHVKNIPGSKYIPIFSHLLFCYIVWNEKKSSFLVSGAIRTCSPYGEQLEGCTSKNAELRAKIEGGVCYCSKDLCNQGLKQSSSIIVFIFAILLIV